MAQGPLPFHYAEESGSTGMTAMSGLPAYPDLAEAAGLGESVRRYVGVRECTQGWTDAQIVTSLVMLNLAGGESVVAVRVLEKDEGLGRVLLRAETHRTRRGERSAQHRRWRRQRSRIMPSPTAVFRYLDRSHDDSEEAKRQPHTAFIPAANDALGGLRRVNADLVGFVQRHSGYDQATLDPVSSTGQVMDATLIETNKQQAKYCYRKYRAYQPLTTYWSEADLMVHSEFRDGNVPAGYEQLRVLRESLQYLPDGVDRV